MTWALTPTPVSFTATSKPPTTEHRFPSFISAQPRRSFHPPLSPSSSSSHLHSSQQDIGGLGHAVLKTLAPAASAASDLSKRDRKQSKQEKQQRTHEERDLSGSEVLLAIQKARARRSQSLKPTTTKKKKERGSAVSGGSRGGGEADVLADCRNVRPLIVKSDWGVRLEELERRLQEFINAST